MAIFCFAFLNRAVILFHNENPPSSDIGFHGSIINLILDEGKLPSWNPYHMGGEPLVTPPGFHFFVSVLILLTGMPLLFAQLVTATFFSSFLVFPAYLVSRRIWRNYSAGLLAAIFAAVSALSIEMISWGGYSNIVSLTLIILIFYIFLSYIDLQSHFHLLIGTLLFGSLIITHTFTLFVFFPIFILYLLFLLLKKLQKIREIKFLDTLRFFTVSGALGILIVSPWILSVLSFYTGTSVEGVLFGGMEDNRYLILAHRSVDPMILTLIIVLIPMFFMLKASRKKYFDSESLLLVAWFLVPIVMTQAYIFGIVTDYSRFIYFINFPGTIILSAGLFYLFRYTSIAINKFSRIKWNKIKQAVPTIIFTASIFIFIFLTPWFILPHESLEWVDFYTTVRKPEATSLEWIKTRTPESSVLVADHFYGWWLSGIGKRTTLSAASLEYLLYPHELEVAKTAQLILDTNYYFDNDLIQVRDDGVYVSEKDTEFGVELRSGESSPIFNIKEIGVVFWYMIYTNRTEINGIQTVAEMETVGKPTMIRDENSAAFSVQYEDELFIVNRTLIVKQGERFAELSYEIDVKDSQTELYHVLLTTYVGEGSLTFDESNSWYGFYYWDQICGQMIFEGDFPAHIEYIEVEPKRIETPFEYQIRQNTINIKVLIGVFDAQDLLWRDEVEEKYLEFLASPEKNETRAPLLVWDYQEILEKYGVSFVVCRDQQVYLKFYENPNFRLLFNNGKVSIFQVVK